MANISIRDLSNVSNSSTNPVDWGNGVMLISASDLVTYKVSLNQIANAVSTINPSSINHGAPVGVFPLAIHSHKFTITDVVERELVYKNLYFDRFYGWCEAWALSYKTNINQWVIALWSIESKAWVRSGKRDTTNNVHHAGPQNTYQIGEIDSSSTISKIGEYEFIDLGSALGLKT